MIQCKIVKNICGKILANPWCGTILTVLCVIGVIFGLVWASFFMAMNYPASRPFLGIVWMIFMAYLLASGLAENRMM